jgi:hypothetical protein
MIGLEVSNWLLVDLLVLPLMFATAVFILLDPLTDGWRWALESLRGPLGLPGTVATRVVELGPFGVAVPYYTAEAAWPGAADLRTGWIVTALLAVLGVLLRGRFTPIGYLLRALAAIQLTAQVWFTFAAPPFNYALPQYVSGLLVLGVVILALAPFLVAATFFIFDFPLWQKLLMGCLLLGHLAVLFPMQVSVHAFIIHRGSLLALPMLFLVFGVLLDVFVYVALYGWGMSWRSGGVLDAVDRRPPVAPPRRDRYQRTGPVAVRSTEPPGASA